MILVDSSIWIDFLSHKASKLGDEVERLIRPVNQTVVTGIIFQEVLQGIKNKKSFSLIEKLLGNLPFIYPDLHTHLKAAELFQNLSSKGIHCSTIDMLISALAVQHKFSLFTLDSDFERISAVIGLKLHRTFA